jgi:SAM-dependent methyltransferase
MGASAPKKRRPPIDLELDAGSRAHYDDTAYYTATYRRRIDDVQYYVALATADGGPVLEYGVGNGRVALPVSRHGIEVTGIDHSRPMLADLRDRLSREPRVVRRRVKLRLGDMRRLRVGRRFPLVICPFNVALHLYTRQDVERFLAGVHSHLTPRGLFALDMSVPSMSDLLRDPSHAYRAPRFRHATTQEVVRYAERYDYDPLRQILFVTTEFEPEGRAKDSWVVPLSHRQFFPQEWEALLHYNGFVVENVFGDFYGGPLTRTSDVMVWHARRKR